VLQQAVASSVLHGQIHCRRLWAVGDLLLTAVSTAVEDLLSTAVSTTVVAVVYVS
jgi:hypothetical protein